MPLLHRVTESLTDVLLGLSWCVSLTMTKVLLQSGVTLITYKGVKIMNTYFQTLKPSD